MSPPSNKMCDRIKIQKYKDPDERIATQFESTIKTLGDSTTPAVFDLANLPQLSTDGCCYTVKQVLLNTLLSESEYLASDLPQSIATVFVNLFRGIQFEYFKKGRILLYKDGKITVTTGKPIWYDQEPLLRHRLNKIIGNDRDLYASEIDLLNPSHRITWCQVQRVWSLKQFRNFNGNGEVSVGSSNGSHMIVWTNGHIDYIYKEH